MPITILIVDDEPFIVAVVSRVLENAGFRVLSAASAEEALALGRAYAGPIHLIVSDVIMPGLRGPELVERFAQIHPQTGCLFMAGLPDTIEICERILARGLPFLPKPFYPAALVTKVQEVLAESGHAEAGMPARANGSL